MSQLNFKTVIRNERYFVYQKGGSAKWESLRYDLIKMIVWIKYLMNLFMNVSEESLFQTIEYGLNDAIRVKKKQFILILYLQ